MSFYQLQISPYFDFSASRHDFRTSAQRVPRRGRRGRRESRDRVGVGQLSRAATSPQTEVARRPHDAVRRERPLRRLVRCFNFCSTVGSPIDPLRHGFTSFNTTKILHVLRNSQFGTNTF